jgi:hypothetical protein
MESEKPATRIFDMAISKKDLAAAQIMLARIGQCHSNQFLP